MAFTVPKFIERKPKIVGPLSFGQFLFFFIGGAITLFLYFVFGAKGLIYLLILVLIINGLGLLLIFGKIGGRPVSVFAKNLVAFLIGQRLFIFKRQTFMPKLLFPEKMPKSPKLKETKEISTSKITERGRLQKLSAQVETKK